MAYGFSEEVAAAEGATFDEVDAALRRRPGANG
jgi:hypothetical protein